MRFTDNSELNYANMDGSDILAGTDVSADSDRKFTLTGLGTWLLTSFADLTLGGSAQTVQAALASLTDNTSTTTTVTIGGVSDTVNIVKRGNVVDMSFTFGTGTTFSSFAAGDTIATLPSGYRPSHTVYATMLASYTSAAYYPVIIRASSDGAVVMSGTASDIKGCRYLQGTLQFSL